MNIKLSALSILVIAILSGCQEYKETVSIEYKGTTCAIPDSSKEKFNNELAIAYSKIDSATFNMLGNRGPKESRMENEDIDDEYDGAIDLAETAKRYQKNVIENKYCVTVDEYWLYTPGEGNGRFVNELEIEPRDSALIHAAKRDFMHSEKK